MTTEYFPRTRRRVLSPTLALPTALAGALVAVSSRSPALALGSSALGVVAAAHQRRRRVPSPLPLPTGALPVVDHSFEIERVRVDPPIPPIIVLDGRAVSALSADDIRAGFDLHQIHVAYQPKVSMGDGLVGGVEALARWWHPERGPISPGEFVPLAERSGLDGRLFSYVLERAAAQVATWHRGDLPIDVAVNISASRLSDSTLPSVVEGILTLTGLPATALILEVTEGQMLPDGPDAAAVVDSLLGLGVRLSIDDFGTGYSSLIQLAKLPFSEVKIDRSFVVDLVTNRMSEAIVTSVVELGERLGIAIVAEGVEDQVTWDHLAMLRCPTAQGYLVCEPAPAGLVEPWMRERGVRRRVGAQSMTSTPR